jgi:predicted nucleotidyltransferase
MISEQTIILAADMLRRASPPGSRVVLFGSYAKGTAGSQSDVDFMVVEPQVKGWLRETDRLYRAVRALRLPIDLIVTTETLFQDKKESEGTVYHEVYRHGREFNALA